MRFYLADGTERFSTSKMESGGSPQGLRKREKGNCIFWKNRKDVDVFRGKERWAVRFEKKREKPGVVVMDICGEEKNKKTGGVSEKTGGK